MVRTYASVCVTAIFALAVAPAAIAKGSIRKVNFRAYLLQRDDLGKNLRRECGRAPLIQNMIVSFGNVNGLPDALAVVEATTCAMGNGGADIVEVFREGPEGELQSLPIDETGAPADLYAGQNWTPRLQIRAGGLTRWFLRNEKGDPLGPGKNRMRREIRYRWHRDRFVIEAVLGMQDPP